MKRYFLFLVLNAAMVCTAIYFFLPGKRTGIMDAVLWVAYLPAILIIALQYRPLIDCKSWLGKAFIFYISMVLFFMVFGIPMAESKIEAGISAADAWAQRLKAVVIIVLYGHIFGGIFYPVVIFINWLFRKQLFPDPRK